MYKTTITLEIESEKDLREPHTIIGDIYNTALKMNTKGINSCILSIDYEKDGEYDDRDECDVIGEINILNEEIL